ncbi:unnamed protein product [Alopecurus aequalis]
MELPVLESPKKIELTDTFSLDLVVQGFVLKEANGRKSYVKGKSIHWNVKSDDFTMDVLMDGLSAELRVGRDQSIAVWYFNVIMAQDVRLTQNDEFHVMFDMYRAEMNLALDVIVLDNPCSETGAPLLDNLVNVSEPTIPDNDVLLEFMKKFHGKVYSDNLYPAARTFSERKFMHHMNIIKEANSEAIEYLDIYHHRLWYRCGFGEASKVDYLTNNISESFNKQIKDFKGLNICNLVERLRELIVEKFCLRRHVGEKLKGRILPHVIKQLNALSKIIGRNKILWTTEHEADVTLLDLKFVKRHIVNLQSRTCTCRVWQVSGKPCMHAIAFICSINGAQIETYVDDYYSVEKFKTAYAGSIPSMTDKSQWINVDLGLKVHPPLQQPMAGRPRVQRFRGWLEPGRKIVKCKKCGAPGHFEKTCKIPDPKYVAVNNDDDIPGDVPDPSTPTNKRKKGEETSATADGDATDDEILINLIRKKSRITPQKPNTPTKEKTPVKIATTQEKAKTHVKKSKKKTPVKKTTASQEKAKTPVKKVMSQEKAKKKTPPKKTTSKGKKSKKNVPFAPVIPPPPPPVVQPPYGAKRSLLHWLGG